MWSARTIMKCAQSRKAETQPFSLLPDLRVRVYSHLAVCMYTPPSIIHYLPETTMKIPHKISRCTAIVLTAMFACCISSAAMATCEQEVKTVCETGKKAAVSSMFDKQGCVAQTPDENIKASGNDVSKLAEFFDVSNKQFDVTMAIANRPDYYSAAPEQKAFVSAATKYWLCMGGAYADAIDIAKGKAVMSVKAPVIPNVPLKVYGQEALPKTKKIILSNFVIEFQKRYEKTTKGFSLLGLGNAGSSTAINDVTLPDAEILQTITNFAYMDTVKKLRAKGYEVIEVNGLSASSLPPYQKMTKSAGFKPGEKLDNIDGDSVLYSPDGMTGTQPMMPCMHYKPENNKFFAKLSAMGRSYTVNYNGMSENEMAVAEGDVPVLKVWMTVGFGGVDAKGGNTVIDARQKSYWGSDKTNALNSANASATSGMFLKQGATRFSIKLPSHDTYLYSTYKQSCPVHIGFGFATDLSKDPGAADGDVVITLLDKLYDDGSAVISLENQAGAVEITDHSIGGGIGIRTIKVAEGTGAQSASNEQGVTSSLVSQNTSGRIDTAGMGTSLHTSSQYATSIKADYFATSAVKMITEASAAMIEKLN